MTNRLLLQVALIIALTARAVAADSPMLVRIVGDGPGKITLTWRAPESGPEVAGYYIYAIQETGLSVPSGEEVVRGHFIKVDVGDRLVVRLEGLAFGRWSFVATAFNPYGLESDPSNVFTRAWLPAPSGLDSE